MVKWQRRSRSLFTKLDAKHSKHVQIALKKFLISEKVWIWQYRLHDEVCFKPLEQGEGGLNSCGIIIMIMETRDLCNSWLFQQVQALGGRNLDYLRHYLFENGLSSYKSVFLQYHTEMYSFFNKSLFKRNYSNNYNICHWSGTTG